MKLFDNKNKSFPDGSWSNFESIIESTASFYTVQLRCDRLIFQMTREKSQQESANQYKRVEYKYYWEWEWRGKKIEEWKIKYKIRKKKEVNKCASIIDGCYCDFYKRFSPTNVCVCESILFYSFL